MSKYLHIANTDVEFEFASSSSASIEKNWSQHRLCLQLQYLPLLYAKSNDFVAVTSFPDPSYLRALQTTWCPEGLPQMILINDVPSLKGIECCSWGFSQNVQKWAEVSHFHYAIPSWEIVCLINSKAFSFRYNHLPNAALLYSKQELIDWLQSVQGPKVLKTCFGLSGMGNWMMNGSSIPSKLLKICQKEWQNKRPMIGEPWLNRLQDFSSQWIIHADRKIEYIGATRFETDANGTYQGTLAGPENLLFSSCQKFLKQHCQFVQNILAEIATMGFFGNIGFDALIYRDRQTDEVKLYPLVEINGRQTMSLVALRLQKRCCPNEILHMTFQSTTNSLKSLLPAEIINIKGEKIRFNKKLTATIQSLLPERFIISN